MSFIKNYLILYCRGILTNCDVGMMSLTLLGTRAGYAVLVSQIAAGVAGLSWTITEFIHVGQPKVIISCFHK